eukprot:Gregarina_sp_Poly_1__1863@NODE_1485_length_4019_cov_34_970648_g577_i1_p3_GENE_NODE_1485_length_4019_cov_34_970648_g577_i1NODE_1485_length_4019_cov_34_970648_g577_i1_p3_ORF_typecomplete_len191_score18_18_NODE_1485_length_4019_cov_34_970648_g577_i125703142
MRLKAESSSLDSPTAPLEKTGLPPAGGGARKRACSTSLATGVFRTRMMGGSSLPLRARRRRVVYDGRPKRRIPLQGDETPANSLNGIGKAKLVAGSEHNNPDGAAELSEEPICDEFVARSDRLQTQYVTWHADRYQPDVGAVFPPSVSGIVSTCAEVQLDSGDITISSGAPGEGDAHREQSATTPAVYIN